MQKIKQLFRTGTFSGVLLVLIAMHTVPVFADASSTQPDNSGTNNQSQGSGSNNSGSNGSGTAGQTPDSSGDNNQKGPNKPTGPDANTYTYNSTTGLWQNQYYTWDPATQQTSPITPPTYSYNPTTGMWDTTQWVYDAASGTYVPNTVAVSTLPVGAVVSSTSPSPSTSTVTPSSSSSSSTSPSGATSNTNTNDPSFDSFYNSNISGVTNQLNSTSQSGNALVLGNTTGGSAASGDTSDIANILNLLQSSSGALGSNGLTTFEDNVTGNVQGDLVLDPSMLVQPASDSTAINNPSDLQVNTASSGQINNNVSLAADSGNASVDNNTSGGNATSGNANAVADIVNMIDSVVAANQSFLGVINIYGNLDGNIVVPQSFINSLLASNGTTPTAQPTDGTLTANLTNNDNTNNNIDLAATTGQATVSNNTSAGNATSGDAQTNLTLLNLTGSQVVGSNDLLVFVNVLGNWVGLIMNAPAGTTAAELGGGITQDTTGATNTTLNNTNNQTINNNVSLAAASGNADVSNNTSGGNATTGNATASANVANINGSNFSLADWFGVLFINVFGSWNGSFGTETSAIPTTNTAQNPGPTQTAPASTTARAFRLENTGPNSYNLISALGGSGSGSESISDTGPGSHNKIVATDVKAVFVGGGKTSKATVVSPHSVLFFAPFVAGGLIGTSLLATDQYRSRKKRQQ